MKEWQDLAFASVALALSSFNRNDEAQFWINFSERFAPSMLTGSARICFRPGGCPLPDQPALTAARHVGAPHFVRPMVVPADHPSLAPLAGHVGFDARGAVVISSVIVERDSNRATIDALVLLSLYVYLVSKPMEDAPKRLSILPVLRDFDLADKGYNRTQRRKLIQDGHVVQVDSKHFRLSDSGKNKAKGIIATSAARLDFLRRQALAPTETSAAN